MQPHTKRALAGLVALACLSAAPVSADFPIHQSTSCDRDATVVHNSSRNEFLVAMLQDPPPGTVGPASVLACRLDAQGNLLSTPASIWDYGTYYPVELYYNPILNHYVEVIAYTWFGGYEAIYAQFLDGFGNQVGSPILLIDGIYCAGYEYDTDRYGLQGMAIAYNTLANEYFITAAIQSDYSGDPDYYIKARRMSSSGALLGSEITLWGGPLAGMPAGHALAYAPVADAHSSTGRYILAESKVGGFYDISFGMYDRYGNLFASGTLPTNEPDGGDWLVAHQQGFCDVAFGYVGTDPIFLLVFEDRNNMSPFLADAEHSGIWAVRINADASNYGNGASQYGPFPVSAICWHGLYWLMPRVEYDATHREFVVVWREPGEEAPPDQPCDTHLPVTHVRAMRLDSSYFDGLPLVNPWSKNCILSHCSGTQPGNQLPLRPNAAVGMGGNVMAVWDDARGVPNGYERDIYAKRWARLPNDIHTKATPVSGGTYQSTLVGAANNGDSSCGSTACSPDLWYAFTAPSAGNLTVKTCGTNDFYGVDTGMDTVLSLHAYYQPTQNIPNMCNDDWTSSDVTNACLGSDQGLGRDSALRYTMHAGEYVLIRVSSYNDTPGMDFLLQVNFDGGGIPGDVDGDGDVDQSDLGALLAAYGASVGDPNWNADADFDGNGCIDQSDLGALLANYGD